MMKTWKRRRRSAHFRQVLLVGVVAMSGFVALQAAQADDTFSIELDYPDETTVGQEYNAAAIITNNTDEKILCRAEVTLEGGIDEVLAPARDQFIILEPQAKQRVIWRLKTTAAGDGKINVRVLYVHRLDAPADDLDDPAGRAIELAFAKVVLEMRNWQGTWRNPLGHLYGAELNLKLDMEDQVGRVTGHIVWTLQASPHPEEQKKIGLQGTEYVRGSYDPKSHLLTIEGYRKDDPQTVIGLDQYRLVLAENGQALGGITGNHGDWHGRFNLFAKPSDGGKNKKSE